MTRSPEEKAAPAGTLQWGRGRLTADDASVSEEIRPGDGVLQWGRGRLTADDMVAERHNRSGVSGFNGAAIG